MKVEQERLHFLKSLYERKFYDQNTPKNTLQKVIIFQKKLQDFKIRKNQNRDYNAQSHLLLLDEEAHQFRPITTHSLSRTKKIKMAQNLQNKIPRPSQLRLILHPQQTGEFSILSQTMRQKHSYSKERNRNQMHRTPRVIDQQSNGYRAKRFSIETAHFFNDNKLSNSERKMNSSRLSKEVNFTNFNQKSANEQKISRSVSKKVFIGGQDLEKAAEEYYESFKQITKNICDYEKQQKKMQQKMKPLIQRKIFEKKSSNKETPVKAKAIKPNHVLKVKLNRTEPKNNKEDEFNWNIELNPWNAGDTEYS